MNLAKLAVVLGLNSSGFHRGMSGVGGSVNKLERQLGGLRKGFSRAGGAMVSLGRKAAKVAAVGILAVTVALGGLINASANFEDAFAGVIKTVDATPAQLEKIRGEIRQMATEIPIAATELAALGETAGALGVPTDQITEFIRVTALLGVTTNVSSEEAADALGRLSNILGLTAEDYGRFGSALVGLGNAGASTEAEILEITKRMGAAGKVAGLTTPQIIGWASAIASVAGMEPERAGTSLQMFLLEVTKMATKSGKDLDRLAKTAGMSSKGFRSLFATDANQALLKFIAGLGKLTKAQKLATLEALGFNDSGVTRALLGMAEASDEVNRQVELGTVLWDENSAMTAEAEKRFRTTKSQIALLKNNLLEMGMTIGDAVLPHVTPLIKGLNDWIRNNHDLIEQVAGRLVRGLERLGGAIGDWIDDNQVLIRQVREFATTVLVGLWDVLTKNILPAIFGPQGIVVGISDWVAANRPLIDQVTAFVRDAFGTFLGMLEDLRDYLGETIPKVIDIAEGMSPWFDDVAEFTGDTLGLFVEGIRAIARIFTDYGPLPAIILGVAAAVWALNRAVLANPIVAIAFAIITAIGLLSEAWENGFFGMRDDIEGFGRHVQEAFKTLEPALTTMRDLIVGIAEAAGTAIRKVQQLLGMTQPKNHGRVPKTLPGASALGGGRATGGLTLPGRAYLVGEDGPEVVWPGRAYVQPNDELGGGGGNTYNVTIHNPVARTAEDDVAFTLRRLEALGA